jgi:hypothetical protein
VTITDCAYLGCKAGPQFIVDPEHFKTPVCGRHLTGKVRDALEYGSPVEVMDFYAWVDAHINGGERV